MSYKRVLHEEKMALAKTAGVLSDILANNETLAVLPLELLPSTPESFNQKLIIAGINSLVAELQADWAQKEAMAEWNSLDEEAYNRERANNFRSDAA